VQVSQIDVVEGKFFAAAGDAKLGAIYVRDIAADALTERGHHTAAERLSPAPPGASGLECGCRCGSGRWPTRTAVFRVL